MFGLVFAVHLMKWDENIKYLCTFR